MIIFNKITGFVSALLPDTIPVPGKILVVDDDQANLMLACLWLDEYRYNYEKAESGEAAVNKFKKGKFSVILMDVEMYKMDGFEATKSIREFEKEHGLKPAYIIALTANALVDDREKCLSNGMDDYISKPINFEELNNRLSTYICAA